MFTNEKLSVGDWILFWILMVIPFVNVLTFLVILLSSDKNPTLRNMLKAQVVLVIGAIVLVILLFSALQPLIRDVIQEILSLIS